MNYKYFCSNGKSKIIYKEVNTKNGFEIKTIRKKEEKERDTRWTREYWLDLIILTPYCHQFCLQTIEVINMTRYDIYYELAQNERLGRGGCTDGDGKSNEDRLIVLYVG